MVPKTKFFVTDLVVTSHIQSATYGVDIPATKPVKKKSINFQSTVFTI